jgi:hypothetical protein
LEIALQRMPEPLDEEVKNDVEKGQESDEEHRISAH